jgi:hypothetical protein
MRVGLLSSILNHVEAAAVVTEWVIAFRLVRRLE